MKRWILIVSYGLGGLVLAALMSLGAFALAGRQIGGPAPQVQHSVGDDIATSSLTPVTKPSPSATTPGQHHTPSSSPSEDDHGGNGRDDSGHGGDDHPEDD